MLGGVKVKFWLITPILFSSSVLGYTEDKQLALTAEVLSYSELLTFPLVVFTSSIIISGWKITNQDVNPCFTRDTLVVNNIYCVVFEGVSN